jgi:protein-S-isoprenylcysteine O-methyltransferase Ste14
MSVLASSDISALSLSLPLVLTTYLSYLCTTPPNPTPYDSKVPDRVSKALTPRRLFIRRIILVTSGLYHAFISLTYPSPPYLLCPFPSHLNPRLFTWSPYTYTLVPLLFLGCVLRLAAFSALGKNFTFRLAIPKGLNTSGLYRYMQHPSYTGRYLIIFADVFLILRLDGVLGCWLPMWIVDQRWFWSIARIAIIYRLCRAGSKRVEDEEAMLKKEFGKEWEEWHARTKRFIPFVF